MDFATRPASRSTPKSLQVAAAAIGNALEWYDFIIFGFLTVVKKNEFISTVATHFKELTICIGLFSGATISFYVILVYMPTFATTQLHLPLSDALIAQSIGLACQAPLVPLFGALSDRIGRKPILIAALLPYLGLAYPLFVWVQTSPTFVNLLRPPRLQRSRAPSSVFQQEIALQVPSRMDQ